MKVKTVKQRNILKTVVKLSDHEHIDENKCSFLESVYLPGFFRLDHISGRRVFFNGNSGISLSSRLENSLTEYDLYLIMEQLVVATERLIHNRLSIQQLLLDTEYIYINEITKELQFLYVPVKENINNTDLLAFMTSLLYQVKSPDKNDTDYITRFIYFLRSLKSYSPKKIEHYIEFKDRSIVNLLRVYEDGDEKPLEGVGSFSAGRSREDRKTELLREEGTVLLEMSEERTVLLTEGMDDSDGDMKTTQLKYPVLERCRNNETIQINKVLYRLGKDANSVDYAIGDNLAISGSHIDFILRGDQCYVMDLNSKNGTSINGRTIPARYEIEVFDGDRIRLADEDFIFHKWY